MTVSGHIDGKTIPLEEAKTRIIAVLNQYHPELAERAAAILYNDERMNIKEVPSSEPLSMMQYRPVGLTKDYLKEHDMLRTDKDYKDRYGGAPFTKQDNRDGPGVIDFVYNGTPDAVMYLVHELGHAIADDIQIEKDFKHSDFKNDPKERQAYFIQNIYTHYTGQESSESLKLLSESNEDKLCLLPEWKNSRESKISKERVTEYEAAKVTFESGLDMSMDGRKALFIQALGGNGPIETSLALDDAPLEAKTFNHGSMDNN